MEVRFVPTEKDSLIKANQPKGLVKLLLVRDKPDDCDFYVRYPLSPGPQPLLLASEKDKDFTFPDALGYTPKELKLELRKWKTSKITMKLPCLTFSDALTVLPKTFPHQKNGNGAPSVIVRPELLIAMSLITIHYAALEKSYRSDKKFMAEIPVNTADELFKPKGDKRLTATIQKILPQNERDDNESPGGRFRGHLIRLLHWNLWNLAERQALGSEWSKLRKILGSWHRWEMLDMKFPEREYDRMGKIAKETPAEPNAFVREGEALRKWCRRIGLSSQTASDFGSPAS